MPSFIASRSPAPVLSALFLVMTGAVAACGNPADEDAGQVQHPDAAPGGADADPGPGRADAAPMPDPPDAAPGPDAGPPPPQEHGCSDLFAQDHLPLYELEISDSEWAALTDEFLN